MLPTFWSGTDTPRIDIAWTEKGIRQMKPLAAMILLGALGTVCGPVVGQLADPPLEWLTNLSAISVMAVGVWYLMTRTLPAMRDELTTARREYLAAVESARKGFTETLDRMSDRHERWENQRHLDSENLNKVLTDLQVNCAAVHATKQREIERDSRKHPGGT